MALPQSSEIRPADVACLGACRLDQGHAERQRYTMFSKFSTRTWRLLGKKRRKRRDQGGPLRLRWTRSAGGPLATPSRAARWTVGNSESSSSVGSSLVQRRAMQREIMHDGRGRRRHAAREHMARGTSVRSLGARWREQA